jgi:hypothetical protein
VDLCGHSMALKALEVVYPGSFFPAFSHAFVVYFLDSSHSDWDDTNSHCHFLYEC